MTETDHRRNRRATTRPTRNTGLFRRGFRLNEREEKRFVKSKRYDLRKTTSITILREKDSEAVAAPSMIVVVQLNVLLWEEKRSANPSFDLLSSQYIWRGP